MRAAPALRLAVALLVAASLTAACGDADDGSGGPSDAGGGGGGRPSERAAAAVGGLARPLGGAADQVVAVADEEVTWSDSSLGCPQSGMMYAQVLTPGFRTVLEVDGVRYRYHAAAEGPPFRCADPREPVADG